MEGRSKAEFIYAPTVSLEWSEEFLEQTVSTEEGSNPEF